MSLKLSTPNPFQHRVRGEGGEKRERGEVDDLVITGNDVVDEDGKATEAKSLRTSETTTGNFHNDRAGFVFLHLLCAMCLLLRLCCWCRHAAAAFAATVTAYPRLAWVDIKFTQACSVGRLGGRLFRRPVGRSIRRDFKQ